jgi:hypothetical protein
VLGGDRSVGPARCVDHAWQLRHLIREHVPDLSLGGWANPHADPAAQVGYLSEPRFSASYFLTQVVSHHDLAALDRFQQELERQRADMPGLYGVFYYRSATPSTLKTLGRFLPVPAEAITREFAAGATADDIAARTIRALRGVGVRHVYVSNLPPGRARQTLQRILALAEQVG